MSNCEFVEIGNGVHQCTHCGRSVRVASGTTRIRARCHAQPRANGPVPVAEVKDVRCPAWVRQDRLAICEECSHYNDHRCDQVDLGCKATYNVVLRTADGKCPLRKWEPSVATTPLAEHVVINCNTHGYGDCITAAWLSEGAKRAGTKLALHATMDKKRLLTLLGQDVVEGCDEMVSLHPTFPFDQRRLAHADGNRLDSWRECLRLQHITPAKPPCLLGDVHRESAAAFTANPYVVLCPQSVRGNREWPADYWLELADRLRRRGVSVWILCRTGRQFASDPGCLESLRWGTIAALMEQARAVVGNDSAPVHLSGLLDVPTVVLLGPTTSNIFTHLPSVRSVSPQKDTMPCVSCWFREDRGYVHYPCSTACAALSNLPVDTVDRAIWEHMR